MHSVHKYGMVRSLVVVVHHFNRATTELVVLRENYSKLHV
jgi:hypothetical protein